jgi:hypothetical protein
MVVTAAMTDARGAAAPTTEVGLVKESDQTGIFIYSKAHYVLYLKNAAGAWVEYATIEAEREGVTVPWGDNTAAFFKVIDASETVHVHRKTGNILYDSTPNDGADDQNTLLTSAGAAAQTSQNYTFPEADGNANQVLTTDGAGTVTWADAGGGGSHAASNFTFDASLIPDANAAYDLGSAEYKVRHLFLSDNSIKFASGDLSVDGGNLTWNGAALGGGGASTKVEAITDDIVLDSSYNNGVLVVENFANVGMIKLPAFSTVGTGYRVKIIVPRNQNGTGQTLVVQTHSMAEMMTGLVSRITSTDGSGFDYTPQSWTGNAIGTGAPDHEENTLTIADPLAGSYIDFFCDGNRWFVEGRVSSMNDSDANDASADFTKEIF